MTKKKILYLSYNGMNEALGASQVLSYLYKLSSDYEFHLISLEKPKDWDDKNKMNELRKEIENHGIHWHPIPYKTDKVGKLLNWLRFTSATNKISRQYKIKFFHCRSYFPALSAYFIQKLRPIKYLFDTRGFAFDERADTNRINRNSRIFKSLKSFEKKLYKNASGVNKLSFEGKRTILENELFEEGDKITPITVIPTCVDLEKFQWIEREYGDTVKIGYVGTAIGWYDFDRTLQALKAIGNQVDYHFTIFNGGQHEFIKSKLKEYKIPEEKVMLEKITFNEMPNRLKEFDVALFYIHQYFSKRASAATKLGELLASGIPVLTNGNVGDHEFYITQHNCGKILDFNQLENYDFIAIFEEIRNIEVSKKCRNLAEKYFSLEKGVEDYKKLYKEIFP